MDSYTENTIEHILCILEASSDLLEEIGENKLAEKVFEVLQECKERFGITMGEWIFAIVCWVILICLTLGYTR